ncbi:MAG: hypothetical protein Q4D80_03350 [Pseudomonadota bacterium]|nr:hypothetical protein [Pseudomonadota bacterium]
MTTCISVSADYICPMKNSKPKYSLQAKLAIAESISTVLMFIMAIWGTVAAYEEGFWHKLMHIVNHYHTEISKIESSENLNNLDNIKELKDLKELNDIKDIKIK